MKNKAPTINGTNFILRCPKPSDIDDRLEIGKSAEFVRMCGGDTRDMKAHTREQMENWYRVICDRDYEWVIEYGGKCIGIARLTVSEEDKNTMYSVGIFDENMLGRGIGTQVTKLVLDFAFSTLKLCHVQLRVLEYNKRAIACYTKCGFQIERILRDNELIEDKWESDIIMGVLRADYMNLLVKNKNGNSNP